MTCTSVSCQCNSGTDNDTTLTATGGCLGYEPTHGMYNDRSGTGVDTTAQGQEVSLNLRSSQVVPQPASWSKAEDLAILGERDICEARTQSLPPVYGT